MNMTMFDSRLLLVLLVVLAPSLGSEPGPDELPDKLEELLKQLEAAKGDFQSVFGIIEEQCPCLSPGDQDCFETHVLAINNTLCDLIGEVEEVIDQQPDDCPPLEGCAVLVAGCNSSDIGVVDPVGTILPSIETSGNVSALTVSGSDTSDYYIHCTVDNPLTLHSLNLSSGTVKTFSVPIDGDATGIAVCDGEFFIAMEDSLGNGLIYNFDTDTGEILVNISCAGRIRIYNDLVYFSDCNEIQCVNKTGGDLETKVKFPVNIKSFDVIDEDTIVFCDDAGGLWTYNDDTKCFKLLDCNVDEPCCDVKINQCSWLIYVAYPDDAVLDIFNHTTCESEGTLTYTTSTPKECPRLDFEPPCVPESDSQHLGYHAMHTDVTTPGEIPESDSPYFELITNEAPAMHTDVTTPGEIPESDSPYFELITNEAPAMHTDVTTPGEIPESDSPYFELITNEAPAMHTDVTTPGEIPESDSPYFELITNEAPAMHTDVTTPGEIPESDSPYFELITNEAPAMHTDVTTPGIR